MSIDEVIQLGEEIQRPEYGLFYNFQILILVSLFVFLGACLLFMWKFGSYGIKFLGIIAIYIGVLIIALNYAAVFDAEDRDYEAMIMEWREEIAIPFIESLPIEKREVVFIKIDPKLASNAKRTVYTNMQVAEPTPLMVSFKDDAVVTRTSWFEVYMELLEEEKPYIEFQRLDQDLGHGIMAGDYNSKIYLPENYQLTEIE